jgi:hypothetical protein
MNIYEDSIMKKFNLRKQASQDKSVISDKSIQENREKMGLSVNQNETTKKNINLSLPVKNKDNTVPFNVQLEAERKNEKDPEITEASMDQKEVDFNSKDKKQVMDINVETQDYDNKKTEAFKNAEGKKDTAFWDKYVGVQLETSDRPLKVKNNIPGSSSQLQNNPERFKGKNVDKMVMASVKDADAMLFHIFAKAAKAGRDLTADEKQQVTDINAGKMRILSYLAGTPHAVDLSPGEYNQEMVSDQPPIIIENAGQFLVYESGGGGEPIGSYSSLNAALQDYPDADVQGGY